MRRPLHLAAAAALLLLLLPGAADGGATPADGSQTSFACQITVMHILRESGPRAEVACVYDRDFIYPFENFPKELYQTYMADITQGTLRMEISPARLTRRGRIRTFDDTEFTVTASEFGGPGQAKALASVGQPTSLAKPVKGNVTFYIVRVSTSDATPTFTLTQYRTLVMGTGKVGDTVPSTRSQYLACSAGQLNLVLAGTSDVKLSAPLTAYATPSDLANAALEKVRKSKKLAYASYLANQVMVMLPPGIGNFLAFATVNGWRTVYSNKWGMSLSCTSHELGHVFGLLHSGKMTDSFPNSDYGDMTGYMGFGQASSIFPLKCFNGFKSWQLGWYASNHLQIADPATTTGRINLTTFVDYKKAGNQPVLINVADTYFLSFNRAKSFNIDTEESKNMVTVTRNDATVSKAVAGLAAGQRYTVPTWDGSAASLVIAVCSISYADASSNATDVAVVSVALNTSFC